LAALTRTAYGVIGETDAQIETRYGKPFKDITTETFGVMRGFISPGYVVGVKVIDGVSEMEMFSKMDQADLSASEIAQLCKANGTGEWKAEQTGKPNWRRWRREDQGAVALYDAVRHFLYISSAKYFEQQVRKIEMAPLTAKQADEKP
jgi:hypothetical protein